MSDMNLSEAEQVVQMLKEQVRKCLLPRTRLILKAILTTTDSQRDSTAGTAYQICAV